MPLASLWHGFGMVLGDFLWFSMIFYDFPCHLACLGQAFKAYQGKAMNFQWITMVSGMPLASLWHGFGMVLGDFLWFSMIFYDSPCHLACLGQAFKAYQGKAMDFQWISLIFIGFPAKFNECIGFPVNFDGLQWISNAFQWFPIDFQWISMIFHWFAVNFHDFQWISSAFQWYSVVFQWISMFFNGFPMNFNGVQWFFNDLQRFSMDFHWISIDFQWFQYVYNDFQ